MRGEANPPTPRLPAPMVRGGWTPFHGCRQLPRTRANAIVRSPLDERSVKFCKPTVDVGAAEVPRPHIRDLHLVESPSQTPKLSHPTQGLR